MNTRQTWIATCSLLAIGAIGAPIMLGQLDAQKLRSSSAAEAPGIIVPVELVLLVDTSGSVDADEYALQKLGYEQAFLSSELSSLIEGQGGIAVTYIEWDDADSQNIRIDWTLLRDADDCWSFANEIGALSRESDGNTMLAPAIEFAAARIDSNGYYGMKRVIDVSGDGRGKNWDYYVNGNPDDGHTDPGHYGTAWSDVMTNIVGQVSQINGICITTDSSVVEFYDALPYGTDAFAMQVADFDEFSDAILEKLLREIDELPGLFD